MSATILDPSAVERALAIRDLTDPAQGANAIQLLVDEIVRALSELWGCPTWLRRAPPIVDVADNYDVLRYPPDDVTRASRYTRYVDPRRVLRTHTSAMIPPLLRLLAEHGTPSHLLLACPGITYRRDVIDRSHSGEPHQLDLWRVRGDGQRCGRKELLEMVDSVVATALPEHCYRVRETEHCYTLGGLEIEVAMPDGSWLEIGECGQINPEVLNACAMPVDRTTGLAMGLGLDRLLMCRKGITDIRLLRSSDPRVACQMLDLLPYHPVSRMPSICRDLSVVVSDEANAETLGDTIRRHLGERAAAVEEIVVVAEYPRTSLPPAVVSRLGIKDGQKNLLLRVVISDLECTLTQKVANELRNEIYSAIHEGELWEWASNG